MTATNYLDVSSASELSADIKAVDLASQADGGNGTHYSITLKAGMTLTESADISAINLALNDTLTRTLVSGRGPQLRLVRPVYGRHPLPRPRHSFRLPQKRSKPRRRPPHCRGYNPAACAGTVLSRLVLGLVPHLDLVGDWLRLRTNAAATGATVLRALADRTGIDVLPVKAVFDNRDDALINGAFVNVRMFLDR